MKTRRACSAILIFWGLFLVPFRAYALAEEELLNGLSEAGAMKAVSADQPRLFSYLEKGLGFYRSIHDYEAVFHKTEIVKGRMGEKEKIYLKFEKPWKIYLDWFNTHKKGLQIVYEKGRNDDKLAIHKPGLLFGLAPVVFLDRQSPWVKEGSESYGIEDAGIGPFLFDFTKAVLRAAKEKRLRVYSKGIARDGDVVGERLEVAFLGTRKDENYFAYRIFVLFDRRNNLPLRAELFDWQNKLTGIYSYHEFKADAGLNAEFLALIHPQLLRVYHHDRS